jgi:hypothetical protein
VGSNRAAELLSVFRLIVDAAPLAPFRCRAETGQSDGSPQLWEPSSISRTVPEYRSTRRTASLPNGNGDAYTPHP